MTTWEDAVAQAAPRRRGEVRYGDDGTAYVRAPEFDRTPEPQPKASQPEPATRSDALLWFGFAALAFAFLMFYTRGWAQWVAFAFPPLGLICLLITRHLAGWVLGAVIAPIALLCILMFVPPAQMPFIGDLVRIYATLAGQPQQTIERQSEPVALPAAPSRPAAPSWQPAPAAPIEAAPPLSAPLPLPTAHVLPQPTMPAAVVNPAAPKEYTHPETGEIYTPAPLNPTLPPYVEPAPLTVAQGSYYVTAVGGVPCVVSAGRRVCDTAGLDDTKAQDYAYRMQAGVLGEPHDVASEGQTCETVQRLDADGVPVGAETRCSP